MKTILLLPIITVLMNSTPQDLSCYEKQKKVENLENDCSKLLFIERNLSCSCFVGSIFTLSGKANVRILENVNAGTFGITFNNIDTLRRDILLIKKNLGCK